MRGIDGRPNAINFIVSTPVREKRNGIPAKNVHSRVMGLRMWFSFSLIFLLTAKVCSTNQKFIL
jgi:hypothetical protein